MKSEPDPTNPIWAAWSFGGYLGGSRARAHGRVTVEPGYWLNTAYHAGAFPWLPVRWWQRADNSQFEIEIPGVQTIEMSKATDQDAHTCTITILNTKLDAFGQGDPANPDFGHPGYLTPDRGTLPNRWGYVPNEWQGILERNCLVRTYQGYGGHGKSIQQAVADGNLVLTGVWLTDTPDFGVSSKEPTIILNCRSMAKLLVDQEVFPPLVPPNLYPMAFFTDNMDVGADYPVIDYGHTTGGFPPTGAGVYVMGIEPAPSSDGYYLVGSDGGVFCYGDCHFFGSAVGQLVTGDFIVGMAMSADADGYLLASSKGYVYAYGDAAYHGGLDGTGVDPIIAIERMGADGYLLVDNVGHVYTYGATAHYYGGAPGIVAGIVGCAVRPQGDGYWLCDSVGHVYTYGSAPFFGVAPTGLARPITGIASTPSGDGYYLVGGDGGVFTFGDAIFLGSVPNTYISTATFTDAQILSGQNVVNLGSTIDATGTPGPLDQSRPFVPLVSDGSLTVPVDANPGDTVAFTIILNVTGITNPINVEVAVLDGNQSCLSTAPQVTATGTVTLTGVYRVTSADTANGGPAFLPMYNGGPATIPTATFSARNTSRTNLFEPTDVNLPLTIDTLDPQVSVPAGITIIEYVDPLTVKISWTSTADLTPVTVHVQRTPHAIVLNDPVTDIAPAPNGLGYWLAAQDGGVFTYSEIERNQFGNIVYAVKFWGSMPGPFTYYLPGNYADFTDIVAYFLLWSGWTLWDGGHKANVYGNIETTGTHSTNIINASTFDKQPVINVIHTLKAIVGYIFFIGDEGEAHWHEPNTWEQGNTLPAGTRTSTIPVIDEKTAITDYKRSDPDQVLRSDVIVSSEDPYPEGPAGSPAPPGTITSHFVPAQAKLLKGMIKPAMWVNPAFIVQAEQQLMAQLIAIQIYFMSHLGSLTMHANPMLEIDDQVQIIERTSFEVNYHYIRGIDTKMNLETGEYTSTITTNIVGDPENPLFVARPAGAPTGSTTITRVLAGGQGTTSVATA